MLFIILIRLSCVTAAFAAYADYFGPGRYYEPVGTPMYFLAAFGAGWGSIITISSLNKFNTNIMKTSWYICIGQFVILTILNMISMIVEYEIERKYHEVVNS